MRWQRFGLFLVALVTEIATIGVQALLGEAADVRGLYYPSFRDLFFPTLVVWVIIYLILSSIWSFLWRLGTRRMQERNTGSSPSEPS